MNKQIHITAGDYSYLAEDLIRCVSIGLMALGYEVSFELNKLHDTAINLDIGATGVSWDQYRAVGKRLIVYNLEQVVPNNYMLNNPDYLNKLRYGFVWDYNKDNVDNLRYFGISNVAYVPVGFVSDMKYIDSADEQDIDVLFYGYETSRRLWVFNEIRELGLNLVTAGVLKPSSQPWTGAYRDQMISRAKVVLNCHAYDTNNVFEIIRVSHLLANKKCVVSEITPSTKIEQDLYPAVVHGGLNQLPLLCKLAVENENFRKVQEGIGYEIFSRRNALEYLYNGMGQYYKWAGYENV